jgi:hypothetical protein
MRWSNEMTIAIGRFLLAWPIVWAALGLLGAAQGQDGVDSAICRYPRRAAAEPYRSLRLDAVIRAKETEPNDTIETAQKVKLGFGPDQDQDVDLTGKIEAVFDSDVYEVSLQKGEILAVVCLNLDTQSGFDPRLDVFDSDATTIISNDNHGGIGDLFPAQHHLPVGAHRSDALVTAAIPQSGRYFIRARGVGASRGEYFLQIRVRHPGMVTEARGQKQVIFLDFDGQQIINGKHTFGNTARDQISLSALASFLPRWGLTAEDNSQVIDAVTNRVQEALNRLTQSPYNEVPNGLGGFGVDVRNSRDHQDSFGRDPLVSRVIVGGTWNELGVETIGLSQYIDPGNFSTNDTAVVLLDLLSGPATDPNSIQSLRVARPTASGATEIVPFADLDRQRKTSILGQIIGTIALHEVGHFLGCFHCRNDNPVCSIMDRGGNLLNMAGVGPDNVLGTADDTHAAIIADYFAPEVFPSTHSQSVEAMFVYALSTGTRSTDAVVADLEAQRLRLLLAKERPQEWRFPIQASVSDKPFTIGASSPYRSYPYRMSPASASSPSWLEMLTGTKTISYDPEIFVDDSGHLSPVPRTTRSTSRPSADSAKSLEPRIELLNARLEQFKRGQSDGDSRAALRPPE